MAQGSFKPCSVVSIKAVKKAFIYELETESTDDSHRERSKNQTGNT